MNKRIEKKLIKNVREKRQRQRLTGARVPLTRPERKLARRHKNVALQTISDALKDCHAITRDMTLSYEATKEVINFTNNVTISNNSCEVMEIEFKDKI